MKEKNLQISQSIFGSFATQSRIYEHHCVCLMRETFEFDAHTTQAHKLIEKYTSRTERNGTEQESELVKSHNPNISRMLCAIGKIKENSSSVFVAILRI